MRSKVTGFDFRSDCDVIVYLGLLGLLQLPPNSDSEHRVDCPETPQPLDNFYYYFYCFFFSFFYYLHLRTTKLIQNEALKP